LLKVEHVEKWYGKGGFFSRKKQIVLNDISFECGEGECLGIIGESGSGKSTLGRLILGIEKPDRGAVLFNGKNVGNRKVRLGNMSTVFQDYKSSINPFFMVEKAILEPLTYEKNNENKVDRLLEQVGLNSSYKKKYPHELSGGEVQRTQMYFIR
jgi:nickel transport system ATP-binding protein